MYQWIEKVTTDPGKMERLVRYLGWIPKPVILLFCWIGGRLIYSRAVLFRNNVQQNMQELMPEYSRQQVQQVTQRYFRNFFMILYELMVESKRCKQAEDCPYWLEGEEYLQNELAKGRGAILFAPHMGNFFMYYWYLSQKYDCLTVATAGSAELRPIYLAFQDMGCKGLDYDSTPPLTLFRQIRRHLQKNGVVLLFGDFYRPSFPTATFFNRKTNTPSGTAVLAMENQAPIIPFYGFRKKGFQHKLVFESPLYLHARYDKSRLSEALNELNGILEQIVRRVPTDWFYWFNVEERWQEQASVEDEAGGVCGG
ncbi:lysophospholipid acyltransferase family protein [Brevibacillus dissolubilis]|uniref:lysophospholipid acyltransferase family protein n=1 Tax=Brevibacillus dissolubilis TaxID=1844116 RepID=UPI001115D0E0|nr:lysophospholipid acyltransferase family protein [Brevibacillus dissolubilis]